MLKAEFYPISIAHAPRTVDFEASTTSIDFQRFAEEGPGAPGEQHTVASLRRREKSGIGGDKAEHPGGKSVSEFRKPGLEANRHVRKWIGVEPSRALEKVSVGARIQLCCDVCEMSRNRRGSVSFRP